MIVHWSNIVCVALIVAALCIGVRFLNEIESFVSCIATVSDDSAPMSQRYLGVFAAFLLMFTVGGVIHITTSDVKPRRK